MELLFSEEPLSILNGEVFESHKKKYEEMLQDWAEYPFKEYRLKAKSKKSYKFRKGYVDCSCGRKANLSCVFEKCIECCKEGLGECKAHKKYHAR